MTLNNWSLQRAVRPQRATDYSLSKSINPDSNNTNGTLIEMLTNTDDELLGCQLQYKEVQGR